MKKVNIAIDGYAACGKSSTARAVARALQYVYIDSGAMYRAVTLYLLRCNIVITDHARVIAALNEAHIRFGTDNQILLNDEDVSRFIRTPEVNDMVSEVSAIRAVRVHLVQQQQHIGIGKGVVMDGRDIGTVVFPDAELKIFMTASMAQRVQRRRLELAQSGMELSDADIQRNLEHRDALDTNRKESPLRRASDARLLDTTSLSFEAQIDIVLGWVQEIVGVVI